MITYTDGSALLAAIRTEPDEDTPRLMWADYLDNLDTVSVSCPACKGKGKQSRRAKQCAVCNRLWNCQGGAAYREDCLGRHPYCPDCDGRFVLDASNRDRAELIRVQCALAQHPAYMNIRTDIGLAEGVSELCQRMFALKLRESALLAANADRWRKGPLCETCGSSGNIPTTFRSNFIKTGYARCPDCDGTGDAGGLMGRVGVESYRSDSTRVDYVRGMKRVHARAADVWERKEWDKGESYFVPTDWARRVCLYHPDLEQFRLTDCEPDRDEGGWEWYNLPDFLNVPETKATFATELAAHTALARAVVAWVHTCVE